MTSTKPHRNTNVFSGILSSLGRKQEKILLAWPLTLTIVLKFTAYESIGCYKDTGDRAIPTLEGKDPVLDGGYTARKNPIEKCYQAARNRGFKVFAVQNGGWCASSATAHDTYDKHGSSSNCLVDGAGGPGANQVYFIRGKSPNLQFMLNDLAYEWKWGW